MAQNLNPTEDLLGDLKMTDDLIWQFQNTSAGKTGQTFPRQKVPKRLNGVLKIKWCVSRVLKVQYLYLFMQPAIYIRLFVFFPLLNNCNLFNLMAQIIGHIT